MGQPYDIEIQDFFELEGTKIFLHFTVIFDVTLEVVIPGDDMWVAIGFTTLGNENG